MRELSGPIPVNIGGGRSYNIHLVPLARLDSLLREVRLQRGPCVVVTDANVAGRWLPQLAEALDGWDPSVIVLPAGEQTKSHASVRSVYDKVLAQGIDRQTPVIAFGGGVIGDLAGFAAATLLRGLPLVHVPTSLIAQVDSAIGGKTGINHAAGKNLIGSFYQPRLVCTDTSILDTLPSLEWASGLAEVVKHALIADTQLLAYLERSWHKVQSREPATVRTMVGWAAAVKAAIVAEDEKEQGRRAILNFGHTFGHAIERVAGYGAYTHGEAVALGMRAALSLSARLHKHFDMDRAMSLVCQIPVRYPLSSQPVSVDALMDAMRYDKKASRGALRLVALRAVGQAYVTDQVTRDALLAAWAAAYH